MCADPTLVETSADLQVNMDMLSIIHNSDVISRRRIDNDSVKGNILVPAMGNKTGEHPFMWDAQCALLSHLHH